MKGKEILRIERIITRVILVCLLWLVSVTTASFAAEDSALIAVVLSDNNQPYNAAAKGFKNYLSQRKADIKTVDYALNEYKENELTGVVDKILSNKQNLIFTLGTYATKVMQKTARNTSVVFAMVLIPDKVGVLPPGVVMDIPVAVKFDNLKKILPSAKKIGLIYSADSLSLYEEAVEAGNKFCFQIIGKRLDSGKEFPAVFEDIAGQIDSFSMIPDSKIYFPKSEEYLLRESYNKKIPVVGLSSNYVKAGALVSFDCDYEDLVEQAAELVLKIMEDGGSLNAQFVTPRKVKFALNLRVAEMLGIKIPPEVLKEASEVFGK